MLQPAVPYFQVAKRWKMRATSIDRRVVTTIPHRIDILLETSLRQITSSCPSPSTISREHRKRERGGGAVLIYTLLFPALVYNYAIFSQTSPYFFVPGDAPRSKSARHEGVVKSTRLVESRGGQNQKYRRGDDPLGVPLRSWYRPISSLLASPFSLFLSLGRALPLDDPFLSVLRIRRVGGRAPDDRRGTEFEQRGGMQQGCELSSTSDVTGT